MEPVNLDNTKALNKIADALGKIAHMKEQEPVAILSAGKEPGEFEALPVGGVPVLLIVEVLISLIGILVRHVVADPVPAVKLRELRKKLMPYQPVRPQVCLDGKEAQWGKDADRVINEAKQALEAYERKTEPASVPILLIIEVLFALIRFVRARRDPMADKVELTRLLDKLEPYLPGAPVKVCLDGKEAQE